MPTPGSLEGRVPAFLEAGCLAENEEQLKIRLEGLLESLCREHGIPWNPYTYEHSFRSGRYRLDVVHGSTIIEYEPPRSFRTGAGAQLEHAREQAEEYCALLAEEEGRRNSSYSLVVWDGLTISFGDAREGEFYWDAPQAFDANCLYRLLALIEQGGKPLVSPMTLKQLIGPETDIGRLLIPALFSSITDALREEQASRTKLIYSEWARLFCQVDGISSDRLKEYLSRLGRMHGISYEEEPQAYVFALNTYIAIVAKVCAVHALLENEVRASSSSTSSIEFLKDVEQGRYFQLHGIQNMLSNDFFSWYLGDDVLGGIASELGVLLSRLDSIDFDVRQKSPESVIDLFKGLYMEFTPAPMRHALGEYYTPDWLAAHVLDVAGWNIDDSFLDPTCGSGTFILEAVKRRLEQAHHLNTAAEILDGIYGFDLNPLAVLTTRASLVVFLSGRFSEARKTLLPIFLADAINTADPADGVFRHSILTEKGERTFTIPYELALSPDFFEVMNHLRICVEADLDVPQILDALEALSVSVRLLSRDMRAHMVDTIANLVELHRNHWNGIWCSILFDRIKAGCVSDVDYVVGNPPWVKWSNLPRAYAEFIKPLCERMDIFSEDTWVGGIQSDISTVVTYHALERFVKPGGTLAFLITGTVFKNESSQGFRRWTLSVPGAPPEPLQVQVVEDYKELKPFEGVANWPALLVVRRNGQKTEYPLPYRVYPKKEREAPMAKMLLNDPLDHVAVPIPGSLDGPWLVGEPADMGVWTALLDAAPRQGNYSARKGVTTDANGIFFVEAWESGTEGKLKIRNDPVQGRRQLRQITALVEDVYVYPLLKGRDVKRFDAAPAADSFVIVPQTDMSGDEKLPAQAPALFQYLSEFRDVLETRSSYRRFQQGKPFWSIWTVGEYTFAPYKVVWKEMSGSGFVAAYLSSSAMPDGQPKVVVPDHKVYFIPLSSEEEAAYLTAFLNATDVASAVNAYASSLSLGTSVVEYLKIPPYDGSDPRMRELSALGKRFNAGEHPTPADEQRMNAIVFQLVGAPADPHT